jgi:hypothetical protein
LKLFTNLYFSSLQQQDISEENVKEVLMIAKILTIPTIIEGCSKILQNKLNVENCLRVWKIAKEGDLENLKIAAFEVAKSNFKEVFIILISVRKLLNYAR